MNVTKNIFKYFGALLLGFTMLAVVEARVPAVVADEGEAGAAIPEGETVTFVVPFPPGGSSDLLARKIARQISVQQAGAVIIENRPGAGGLLGSRRVAEARPDGRTIGLGVTGSHAISHSLYHEPPYDPATDFEAISLVVTAPLVVAVHPDIPANTIPELLDYAAQHEGELSYSTPGVGTSMHLTGEMFGLWSDHDLVHVPYQGSGPAVNDFLAGRVSLMFGDLLVLLPHIQSGDAKALAVTSAQRHPLLPETPALNEIEGFAGFEALSWQGVFAPKGTPQPLVDQLNKLVVEALHEPEVQAFFAQQGFIVEGSSPEDFQAFVTAEKEKWANIVAQTGIEKN